MKNKERVNEFFNNAITKLKIAVIGDLMLDRYYFGEVKRISPEAPVPVNRVHRESMTLGGAGNVANNLAQLGVQVFAAGLVGADSNKEQLLTLMQAQNIDTTGLIVSQERPTITKLRVIGGSQQMLRLDFEQAGILSNQEQVELQAWLDKLLAQGLDAVIISDYAKGVCTPELCQYIIKQAHYQKVPVLVDPKGSDWHKYAQADYITPNVKEMGECIGLDLINEDEAIIQAAQEAMSTYAVRNIVVTRSEKGLTYVGRGLVLSDQATAREVFDVSGAGDTMAATFMSAVAGKLVLEDCLQVANLAAGVVVGKVGTQPIMRAELLESLQLANNNPICAKIASWEQAQLLIKNWQQQGKKVIFTNGCFDILHIGHANYLAQARNLGDKLVVGLNADSSVRALKGATRPLVDEEARAGLLASLACVDMVVLFTEQTPEQLLSVLRPDVLVKGGDYQLEQVLGREYVQEVALLDFTEGYSTSNLVEKISKLAKEGKL
ncbi:D-glycero-beta-D-manno-heptose-7-phosphate kinase [Succinispira mobilis]|uniref:D-glycero-beta-D-manno-heptose-7-phosphate kinase n=1 Tax=Succinispira mobilis TaxID=78120 RepID=UPI000371278D|nr:D-glycero-beta-D-manno-heptose-7-phosphate kinase [Succinispira mobilis]